MDILEKPILNKSELIKEIQKREKWDLSPMTFWTWDRDFDFIKPFYRSATAVLVYSIEVGAIIKRLKQLHKEGKISIKAKVR